MKTDRIHMILLVLAAMFVLNSCSSSGGGVGGSGIISSGTVSAHGSIFVNGLEFDTSEAVTIVNGEKVGKGNQTVLDYLDVGKVVIVEGTGDMDDIIAVADRVTYYDNVAGPVESIVDIDATTREIMVLGQRVVLNVVTTFKETTFDTIAQNDLVEVSGLVDDMDTIRATFVGKTGVFEPGNIVGVTGFIVNLDEHLKTFQVNDLTVSYSGIDIDNLPAGFEDNLWVEVEGTLDAAGGEMTATSIEHGDEIDEVDSDQIEVLGFVTAVDSPSEFTLGNEKVQVDGNTEYVDGDSADISIGAKLEAEGYLEGGILYADEVEFWGPDQVEVEGLVTNIASDSEFTVGDQVVQTDAGTVFEPEGLDIIEDMMIEIKGVPVDIVYSVIVADKVSLEED